MLTIKNYVKPQTLQEAYDLNQNRSNLIIAGMLWSKMQSRSIDTAIDLSDLNLNQIEEFDDEIHINIRNKMEELKDHNSKQGAHIQIQMTEGYPAVINDSNLVDQVRKQISNISEIKDPLWIAEDFSFYQKKVPSVFFFLGTGTKIPLHTNIFDFDEKILIQGVLLYMKLSKMR